MTSAHPGKPITGQHQVSLKVGGWSLRVDVDPPTKGPVGVRPYPIPPKYPGANGVMVEAKVVYTSGRSVETLPELGHEAHRVPFRDWFVKAFWCASPQEAVALLRHFTEQSNDVLDINQALGGNVLEPPWAVAPVWVVPAIEPPRDVSQRTRVGADAAGILERTEGTPLWEWFEEANTNQRENCFLVLTPYLPEGLEDDQPVTEPRMSELQKLKAVAEGLDAAHEAHIAHCDVKPDNLRKYFVGAVDDFVLIDTDAIVRVNTRPRELRLTPALTHPAFLAIIAQGAPTPDQLKAHDRYGFALVVLHAVAGVTAVDAVMSLVRREGRPATSEEVARIVGATWQGTGWGELITSLAAPFGLRFEELAQSPAVEWVKEVLNSQPGAPGRTEPMTAEQCRIIRQHRQNIQTVRTTVRSAVIPADRPDAVLEAIRRTGMSLARRRFLATFWPIVLLIAGFTLLVLLTLVRDS